jgi:hypothetical protein
MKTVVRCLVVASFSIPTLATAAGPSGWFLAGSEPQSYVLDVDNAVVHEGKSSARLASKEVPKGFGTMMQTIDPGEYHGKRLKLSGFVKASKVTDWAGLWMRVDGPEPNHSLAFDNMQGRSIKGTKDWTRYDIVLDVADNAKDIAFGILLHGSGTVWLDDVQFEIVDTSVPTTDMTYQNRKPANLDFEH